MKIDIKTSFIQFEAHFLGVAAIIINNCFEQELLIIGMACMTGNHSPENIKREIELLVNRYKCNKSKFHGKNTTFLLFMHF